MKCDSCQYKKLTTANPGGIEINCQKNGKFKISYDFSDRFNCPHYQTESIQQEKSKEPNAIVILNSGREIPVYNENGGLDLNSTMEVIHVPMKGGYALIRCSDVSAVIFLEGDEDGRLGEQA